MDRTGVFSLEGKTAMLATMHGKALFWPPPFHSLRAARP